MREKRQNKFFITKYGVRKLRDFWTSNTRIALWLAVVHAKYYYMMELKRMWIWCKIKKNMPKMQVLFWNVINKIIFQLNGVSFEKRLKTRGRVYIYNGDLGKIHIGEDVRLNSADWANPIGSGNHIWIQMVGKEASLSIGNGTGISNAAITCASNVEIGNDVLIGSGTRIYDTDFHSVNWNIRKNERGGGKMCSH